MGSSGKTSSTSTALPAWLRPYAQNFIKTYAGEAFDIDPATGQYKVKAADPGLQQQLAGFTPEQLQGMNQITTMAAPAQQLANLTGMETGRTIAGDYLGPESNPYLKATFESAASGATQQFKNATMPGIMAAAQRAGQFGSSAMNESLGDAATNFGGGLNDLATKIYGGNYASERQRQIQAMGMAPQSMANLYAPAYQQLGVGSMMQQQQQAGMDTDYMNAVQRSEYPFSLLSGFGGALGQAAGGAGSSTTKSSGGGMFGK